MVSGVVAVFMGESGQAPVHKRRGEGLHPVQHRRERGHCPSGQCTPFPPLDTFLWRSSSSFSSSAFFLSFFLSYVLSFFLSLKFSTILVLIILVRFCVLVFPYHQSFRLLLSEDGHGIFNVRNSVGACCVPESDRGTDDGACKVLTRNYRH